MIPQQPSFFMSQSMDQSMTSVDTSVAQPELAEQPQEDQEEFDDFVEADGPQEIELTEEQKAAKAEEERKRRADLISTAFDELLVET